MGHHGAYKLANLDNKAAPKIMYTHYSKYTCKTVTEKMIFVQLMMIVNVG